MLKGYYCAWCDYEYPVYSGVAESLHLSACPVFQTLPAIMRTDGKLFVELPGNPDIHVERLRIQ